MAAYDNRVAAAQDARDAAAASAANSKTSADAAAASAQAAAISEARAAASQESALQAKAAAEQSALAAKSERQLAQAADTSAGAHEAEAKAVSYTHLNKYDFLEQDEAGEWYWNDRYLFSTDSSGTLAQNREAMWQETRMNLQQGAFGDPNNPDTLIMFWTLMEGLHYPLALSLIHIWW